MIGLFLQTAGIPGNTLTQDAAIGLAFGVLIFYLIFWVFTYVFTSLAYTSIGKKASLTAPALAWIPGLGPLITAFRASKMHWWPWILSVGFVTVIIAGVSAYAASLTG